MVKTTFIIDDDAIYVYAIKRLISIRNFSENVLVFKNGKEAIDYLTNTPITEILYPNTILLDVRMPMMDGWGFLEAYSQLNFKGMDSVDVFMVSSSIDPRDLDKAGGFSIIKKYLFKPINLEDLQVIFSQH